MFSSNTSQVSSDAAFIEDVFSTWLYTGTGSTQTINNGIDLAGKGGLVWVKNRSSASNHAVFDTLRGGYTYLSTNLSSSATTDFNSLSNFNASGFNLGSSSIVNASGANFASWTFREQPKFFDAVFYVGNGVNGRQIAHSLGSEPGAIIFKAISMPENWPVYHRSTGTSGFYLNGPNSAGVTTVSASHTSTTFTVTDGTDQNMAGSTYVAYLFAHNAGGFGATGADNVISCGSFTTDGSGNATVSLGYEPQWCMFKRAVGGTGNWTILDNMRGWPVGGNDNQLQANLSSAETSASDISAPNATGFSVTGIATSSTYIYIAIRRGPMRTPTSGTSVFQTTTWSGTGSALTTNPGIVTDLFWSHRRNNLSEGYAIDRLRNNERLYTNRTNAGSANTAQVPADVFSSAQTTIKLGSDEFGNNTSTWVLEAFRRAPGFFDVVCYTGNGSSSQTLSHNLGVAPELAFVKSRSLAQDWPVYAALLGTSMGTELNSTSGFYNTGSQYWVNFSSSSFSVGNNAAVNFAAATYVAYLFASCPGVSKVGTYTGTGATQVINCGFSSGARFVLIKRTDNTGDWYVWDSARGIVAGNDPYLRLNSDLGEVTGTDWVDTAASGFELSNAAGNLVNTNGASYIFLSVS